MKEGERSTREGWRTRLTRQAGGHPRAVRRSALLAAGLFALIAAWLVTPGVFNSVEFGQLGAGMIAPHDIKADRDYTLIDEEASRRVQEEALAATPRVYSWYPEKKEEIKGRIAAGFSAMEQSFADFVAVNARIEEIRTALTEAGIDPEAGDRTVREAALSRIPKLFSSIRVQPELMTRLLADYLARRPVFVRATQTAAPDDVLESFARANFDPTLRETVLALIEAAMSRHLFSGPFLSSAAGGPAGIRLRIVGSGGAVRETFLADFDSVLNLRDLDQFLAREAAGLQVDLPPDLLAAAIRFAHVAIEPTLEYDRQLTDDLRQQAQAEARPVTVMVEKGEMVVREGERIQPRQAMILAGIAREQRSHGESARVLAGAALLIGALMAAAFLFFHRNVRKFRTAPRDVLFLLFMLLATLVVVRAGAIFTEALAQTLDPGYRLVFWLGIPVAFGAMVVRAVRNSETAVAFSLVVSILTGMALGNSLHMAFYALLTSLAAAHGVGRANDRSALLKAGLLAGLAGVAGAAVLVLLRGLPLLSLELPIALGVALAGGVLVYIIASGVIPLAEKIFGYMTDLSLLELATLNHPLLKLLIQEAPGTYNHSVIVGSMVETAAGDIGANPLLAKVAAYYHDIGKTRQPEYFAENQYARDNRHDQLSPYMSAKIIISHVRHGIEIAEAHRLGRRITDIIEQHHGSSLIRYFHQKALETGAESGQRVAEEQFRYPFRKPQTREAGLVMLADAVEAATRTVNDPTPERLTGLIQKIINGLFSDGQLDECELTLKDMHAIARSFSSTITTRFHRRPEYPESALKAARETTGRQRTGRATTDARSADNGNQNGKQTEEGAVPLRDGQKEARETLKRLGQE